MYSVLRVTTLEIDADQARAIIDLLVMATEFRAAAGRAGLLSLHYSVTAGTSERVSDFRLVRIPFVETIPFNGDQPVVRLPNDFSPYTLPGDDEWRVECHRIEIEPSNVRFTALAKHGDRLFTTVDLELRLLQTIAESHDDGLPHAELTSRISTAKTYRPTIISTLTTMANYYCSSRTNYFRVKDAAKFIAWAAHHELTVHPQEGASDHFALAQSDSYDGAFPSLDHETEEEIDFAAELATHVDEGSVAVILETGAEKLRFFHGHAIAINARSECIQICLDDIYTLAAQRLPGKEVTRAEY